MHVSIVIVVVNLLDGRRCFGGRHQARLPGHGSPDRSTQTGSDEATEDRPEGRPEGVHVPDAPRVQARRHPVEAEDVQDTGDADRDRRDHEQAP